VLEFSFKASRREQLPVTVNMELTASRHCAAVPTPRKTSRPSQSSGPRSDDHHERPESCLVPLPQPTGGARAALVVLVPAPLALPAAVRPRPAGGRASCHITLSIRYDRWRLLSSWVVRCCINGVG